MNRYFFIFLFIIPLRLLSNPYPVTIINGLLVSKATIEGKEVVIIFDTGAPGLILNSRLYSTDSRTKIQCAGVNGNFECQTYSVKEWNWLGIRHKRTTALLSDLSSIEDILHKEIYALVGLSAVGDYYVSINFDKQYISLSDKMEVDKHSLIRFQYAEHIPVISCRINGEKKLLGLDTGSEVNYLFSADKTSIGVESSNSHAVIIVSPDNREVISFGRNMELTLKDETVYPSAFIMGSNKPGILLNDSFDGLLGQPFLSRFNITIHPSKQIVIFSPRTTGDDLPGTLTAQL
ncbi:MAG: aspartyl protease family protein [Saprospiraceae bacterium]